MNSELFYMDILENCSGVLDSNVFIFYYNGEERSTSGLTELIELENALDLVIVFCEESHDTEVSDFLEKMVDDKEILILILNHQSSQIDFINKLRSIEDYLKTEKIVLDISCIKLPQLFIIMKYIQMVNNKNDLYILNTIPFDYIFNTYPFSNYKSYEGDLNVREIIGYSGKASAGKDGELFLFLGFERALSLKIIEETTYSRLHIVSLMPAYYQKYKDIAIVNNGNLGEVAGAGAFVPADNPFEVYNFLDNSIDEDMYVSIAPLSTKPVALGICLYALDNSNVRIIFPDPTTYVWSTSTSTHITNVYRLQLLQ